jgi:hypothetical protein
MGFSVKNVVWFCGVRPRWANDQASSAMGRAPAPEALACALDAVPASTRLAMPCRMAAMRNRL